MPKSQIYRPFDDKAVQTNLRRTSVRGGIATMLSQGCLFAIGLVSTAILARLLSPADFGLVAMVAPIIGLVALFSQLGLSDATVQSKNLTHQQASTLFWINTLAGLLAAIIAIVISPLIARFYGDSRLTSVSIVAGISLVLGGLGVQHRAIMRRRMRFGLLSIVSVSSTLVGAFAAIVAAWYGAGYWSLVIMPILTSFIALIGIWIFSGWWPGFPRRGTGIRPMLKFGGYMSGFVFINYLARNLDNVFIGKYWGEAPLGLYAKAYALLLLPLSQVNQPLIGIATPMLSRLRDEPERFKRAFREFLSMATALTLPCVAMMAVMAEEICLVVLGPKWIGIVPVFRVLACAALAQSITNPLGSLMVSNGRPDRMFWLAAINTPLTAASFIIGLPFGIVGVAISYSAYTLLFAFPTIIWACHDSPVHVADIVASVWQPLIVASTFIVILYPFNEFVLEGLANGLKLALAGIVGLGIWALFFGGIFKDHTLLKSLRAMT